MDASIVFLRFLFGLTLGSFLNVLAFRYDPDRSLFSRSVIGWTSRLFGGQARLFGGQARLPAGRSHCPHCGRTLRWFELIPFLSFIVQLGKCRSCRARISFQYPIVELLSGLAVAGTPFLFSGIELWMWTIAALVGILIAAIDARLALIPDETVVMLVILGVIRAAFPSAPSFFGHYALLFPLQSPVFANRLLAAALAAGFFGLVVAVTRGRGMGLGDVKLAGALGLLLGFPDVLLAAGLAFITGSLWSLPFLLTRRKGLKSVIPFGPFLILGAFLTVCFGFTMVNGYFAFFSNIYGY